MDKKEVGGIWLAVALLAGGCATQKYVDQQVGEQVATVQQRVDGVQAQVEQVQSQLKEHDARILENARATQAASKTAQEALERALAAGKLAEGKLLYETVLSDDRVKFSPDSSKLSPEAEGLLREFVAKLKAANENVYLEIQGHTDNVGSEEYNLRLGEKRAEAVRRFLSAEGIPLHRMSVISYGESAPVADNKSREGRAANRRVVIVVLK
jgi:outer membrane protein OmpA-like peptidoglycan-associated protein